MRCGKKFWWCRNQKSRILFFVTVQTYVIEELNGERTSVSLAKLRRICKVCGWFEPNTFSLITSARWYSGSASLYLPWLL